MQVFVLASANASQPLLDINYMRNKQQQQQQMKYNNNNIKIALEKCFSVGGGCCRWRWKIRELCQTINCN